MSSSRLPRLAVLGLSLAVALVPAAPALAGPDGPRPAARAPLAAPAADGPAVADDVVVTEVPVVVAPVAVAPAPDGPPVAEALVAPDGDAAVVADEALAGDRVVAEPVRADDAQTVGVTWPEGVDGAALDPQVRTLEDGVWTGWQPMPVSDEAPDAGTADAEQALRAGTEGVWVGDVEAVQLSFAAPTDGAAAEVELSLVGSELLEPAPAAEPGAGRFAASPLPAAVTGEPRIYTRQEWGAATQSCTPTVARRLVAATLHHTAGSNAYSTVGEAMQQLRNDQRYHMVSRGWCDLGYNAVVDKWGNIYEGRAKSLTQPVVGVHAGGFNTGTFGISMLGTYSAAPSAATQRSVGLLVGRRLAMYEVDPTATIDFATSGGENSKFTNTTVTLPRIFAHRDVAYTSCPGDGGYAALGQIRAVAAQAAADARAADALRVVDAIYQDLLERAPDPEGRYDWAAQIVAGTRRSQVGASVASSPEYVTARVEEAYQAILGRSPDPEGLKTWTTFISTGRLRTEDLRGTLISSDEYYLRSGSSPSTYVTRLYRDILGRPAGADEVLYWTDQMTRSGRGAAATGVWWSLESGYLRVDESYHLLLDRSADPVGATMWAHHWLGHGEASLRAGIVDSEEYLLRARARGGA